MALKELLQEIHTKRTECEVDPADYASNIRAGIEGKVRHAKEQLPLLERQYMTELEHSLLLVELLGAGAEDFAKLARSKMRVVALDYTGILDRLVSAIQARGGQDTFGSNEQHLLLSELMVLKNTYAIAVLPPLVLNEVKPSVFEQPIRQAIKQAIEYAYGSGLYDAITLRDAQVEGLRSEFTGKVMPILVYNYTAGNPQMSLLSAPAFRIETTADVTAEFVKNEILAIRDKLKKPTKTAEPKTQESNQETGENNG